MSAIFQVLWPTHPNQIRSTQSKLQSLMFFSPFFIYWHCRVVYQLSHVTSWANQGWILTYCLTYQYCPSLTVYTFFPHSAFGYFPPFVYFRTPSLGWLIFHGTILNLLTSPPMPWINLINTVTALTTSISLFSFFLMNRVTIHCLRVRLLVPRLLVLSYPFEALSGAMRCDRIWN